MHLLRTGWSLALQLDRWWRLQGAYTLLGYKAQLPIVDACGSIEDYEDLPEYSEPSTCTLRLRSSERLTTFANIFKYRLSYLRRARIFSSTLISFATSRMICCCRRNFWSAGKNPIEYEPVGQSLSSTTRRHTMVKSLFNLEALDDRLA